MSITRWIEGLVRGGVLGLVGVSALALVLGRYGEQVQEERVATSALLAVIEPGKFQVRSRSPGWKLHLLDRRARMWRASPRLPEGLRVRQASCSPWLEPGGGCQLAGYGWLWETSYASGERVSWEGLVRVAYPSGRILSQVPGIRFLNSPPCWVPGLLARVVATDLDGRAYLVDFERAGVSGEVETVVEPAVQRLAWVDDRWRQPSLAHVTWPADTAFGGWALATARDREGGTGHLGPPALWRVRIEVGRLAIVSRGLLARGAVPWVETRAPVVFEAGPGRYRILFLSRECDADRYDLRTAPLVLDARYGRPSYDPADARLLASGCRPTPPVVSVDGRYAWIDRPGDRPPGPSALPSLSRVPIEPAPRAHE